MPSTLTIGQLARQIGVTTKTIRYYEAIGLLPPAERSPNGYRRFRQVDLKRMTFIQRAKSLGLTLEEIRDLVAHAEHGHCTLTRTELRQILARKIDDCTERIQGLIEFRSMLERTLEHVSETAGPDDAPCPSCDAFAPCCTDVLGLPAALDIAVEGNL